MRTLFCSALLIASCASSAFAGYVDPLDNSAATSPLASHTQLQAITHAGARLVAAGWRGHILTSADAGKTWKQSPTPVDIDLTAVDFPTASRGWAVGHGGVILSSHDGGLTWTKEHDGRDLASVMLDYYQKQVAAGQDEATRYVDEVKQNTEGGPEQPWLDVHFTDEKHGYIVGTFNQIIHTDDGGLTWTPLLDRIDNPQALHLNAIAELGADIFIASEQGTVFRKKADQPMFEALSTGYSGTFFGLVAQGDSIVAFGLRGNVYRSVDHGDTWNKLETDVDTAVTAGTFINDGTVLLVTQAGQILHQKNPQSRFEALTAEKPALFTGVTEVGKNSVVIVGTAGVAIEPIP